MADIDEIPAFSVIVPTLNEADEIEQTLRRARTALGPDTDILVVDGGSRDDTLEIAAQHARTLSCPPGRGSQLREGAAVARGQVFVFLHADTWLEPGAGRAIRNAVASGSEAGCLTFALRPPDTRLHYRVLERGVNWRTRRFSTATGDQAIFVTRGVYEKCGGIPPLPLFEDVSFVRALRGVTRFTQLSDRALTSRRRWERRGFARTLLVHWGLWLAYLAGADPRALTRFYERGRKTPEPSNRERPDINRG